MKELIDTYTRDLCSVGFRVKSKTRRLLEEFADEQLKMIDRHMFSDDPYWQEIPRIMKLRLSESLEEQFKLKKPTKEQLSKHKALFKKAKDSLEKLNTLLPPLKQYEQACTNITKAFLKELDIYEYDWIGQEIGGCLYFSDKYINMDNVVDYFRYRYTSDEFEDWYWQYIESEGEGVNMRHFKLKMK